LPSLDLLSDPPDTNYQMSEAEQNRLSRQIEQTLEQFKITVEVVDVMQGPVVTRFALHVAPGIKISRILALENDLALALKAQHVRILAPIPGQAAVGIEVPNKRTNPVMLKELMECDELTRSKAPLAFPLGKNVSGEPVVADLSRMPHLLIAGATGAGKSVCLNSIIAAMLFRNPPDRVKMIMIDPKRVELSIYQAIPHLLAPVVAEPRKASAALAWAVEQMETRYKQLSRAERAEHRRLQRDRERPSAEQEVDGAGPEVHAAHRGGDRRAGRPDDGGEERGGGIHHPAGADGAGRGHPPDRGDAAAVGERDHGHHQGELSDADRVSGVVEGGFADDSGHERGGGAAGAGRHALFAGRREAVPAAGHVRFRRGDREPGRHDPGAAEGAVREGRFRRAADARRAGEGAADAVGAGRRGRVEGDEVEDANGPLREDEIERDELEDGRAGQSMAIRGRAGVAPLPPGDLESLSDEDLFDIALRLVFESRKASVSYIQSRLRIGYARAGRLMDMMEEQGIVGPYQGSKPRDIIVDPAEYLNAAE
jgi:DNA segregation ATPase FtsK/SpoIIIE, S-DNA-T family